ncbi:hypothetical protein BKH46_02555 [Helicobacter sp. 12S02634-8]|uniref:XRE family transcriptional regulator n=1 Tax=Helicobacter sp. 12S02634-8 TaxID=1476199 RepID=UPI000BA67103|nr:XRE family transcriptional regulator [Helicobacter sp. 12S02634-8]PAF47736.1 hypothetical protein BKH46_02555 [Helicobacter sp. 12S02634-8]
MEQIKKVGYRIKKLREERGLSQTELGEKVEVPYRTIQRWENGESPDIKISKLTKIAQTLNVDIGFLLEKEENSCSSSQGTPKSKIFIFDLGVSAGHGLINSNNQDAAVGDIELEDSFLKKYFGLITTEDLFIVNSSGDSMSPTIPTRCQLLVQKREARENQICVVRIGDEYYVKRLQKRPKIKLVSDNKDYDPIIVGDNEDFELIGVVVGQLKNSLHGSL